MTLPNKLTMGRIVVVPVMVAIACIPWLNQNNIFLNVNYANFINFILFVLASLTDFLDGYIARKYNLVTTFGKFADPLADKMLVLTSLMILMVQNANAYFGNFGFKIVALWAVAIILIRELMVSGIRLVAAQKGEVIAAGMAGKVKTFVTMIAIGVAFLAGLHNVVAIIALVLIYVSVILTVYSGIVYFINAKKIILESV
ncbi:MAG: CDP-diacylglycerol--glycerol-3-phosphate 3-phosphatidyltransferase [Acholeplasmatales bacterium]|nr:CDP-diacylglycerol--glycerol-3-phosphate 3-phosphatidyltransferase [Acholeplasmatales bacterium]